MTNLPPTLFTLTAHREPPVLTVRVAGELDYDTGGELTDTVADHLTQGAALREVRLDFRHLTWIDSSGLSALLMVHRSTGAAGAELHLDNRPDVLERVLHLTNVLDHLTGPAGAQARPGEADRGSTHAEVPGDHAPE